MAIQLGVSERSIHIPENSLQTGHVGDLIGAQLERSLLER